MLTASIRIHVGRIPLGAPLAEKYPLRRKPEGIILLIIGKPALDVFFTPLLRQAVKKYMYDCIYSFRPPKIGIRHI